MAEIEFQDATLGKFMRGLSANLKKVENGERKFLALLSAIVFRDVIDHFDKEQGEDQKWAKWSDSYRKHMEEIGRAGNKILQFNGQLRQNFKPTNVKKSSQGITWFNNAKTKSGFPYAYAHNEGGDVLPKRDFMWASDRAVEDMSQVTLGFILEEGL